MCPWVDVVFDPEKIITQFKLTYDSQRYGGQSFSKSIGVIGTFPIPFCGFSKIMTYVSDCGDVFINNSILYQ